MLMRKLVWVIALVVLASPAVADKYDEAVANPKRPETESSRDAMRDPALVLRTIGIKPGQTILDIGAGSGYYSFMLADLVGATGKVLLQNPSVLYQDFYPQLKGLLAERLKNEGYSNVSLLDSDVVDLSLEDNSVDLVFMHLFYHDLYWAYPNQNQAFDAEISRVLKPGGQVVIIDHEAPVGSGNEHALDRDQGIHRIESAYVQNVMQKVGLELVKSYGILQNPEDQGTEAFFSEGLRGKKTNRFFHIYEKPDA